MKAFIDSWFIIGRMQNHAYVVNGFLHGTVSPLDRGLAYGDGVFRTIKVVDGMPECWSLHYQKLEADCSAIGIVCPSADLLMSDMQQLIQTGEDSVAKIIITRGDGERGYTLPAVTMPSRIVIKSAMPQYPNVYASLGVRLIICGTRLSHQPKLAGVKHLNRLENVLARMEWHDPEILDGILTDNQNHVVECTSANIFARYANVLVTPRLDNCGVAGVTRQRIIEAAHSFGLQAKVDVITIEQLLKADEIIICNSIHGALSVRQIQENVIPTTQLANVIRRTLVE